MKYTRVRYRRLIRRIFYSFIFFYFRGYCNNKIRRKNHRFPIYVRIRRAFQILLLDFHQRWYDLITRTVFRSQWGRYEKGVLWVCDRSDLKKKKMTCLSNNCSIGSYILDTQINWKAKKKLINLLENSLCLRHCPCAWPFFSQHFRTINIPRS